ncbi:MAG: hypothetical protein L0H96_01150 [Humibacillus sp.]|nr:hypothetical protein [Humibacillus sp.]MDN5775502.1 hypothetical protein [Humibacillus sp.]
MNGTPAPRLTLAGIRFTDDVARMRAYLEALGLSAGITRSTTQADWAAMHAGAGQVLLHSAATSDHRMPSGTTLLTGETPDVAELAGILEHRGPATVLVDEAYARSLEVIDPLGALVVVNETQTDTYGYDTQRPEPDPGVEVVLSRFTDPTGPYADFALDVGLHPVGEWGGGYAAYGAGRGILGLHHDDGSTGLGGPGPHPRVALGFYTSGHLEQLQQRLSAAGFEPGTIVLADFGSRIETVDPDGQHVEIHHRSR